MKLYAQFYKKDLSGNIVEKTGSEGILPLDGRCSIRTAVQKAGTYATLSNIDYHEIVGFKIMSGSLLSPIEKTNFLEV